MQFFVKILVTAIAVVIGAYLLPGVWVDSFLDAIIVAFVLGLLNAFLKPLIVILTFPVTILSFGIFYLVINTFIILLTDYFVIGLKVENFWYGLLFSIMLTFLNWLLLKPWDGESRNFQRRNSLN